MTSTTKFKRANTLDEKAKECDISRNELINQMILFALANMADPSEEKYTARSYAELGGHFIMLLVQ